MLKRNVTLRQFNKFNEDNERKNYKIIREDVKESLYNELNKIENKNEYIELEIERAENESKRLQSPYIGIVVTLAVMLFSIAIPLLGNNLLNNKPLNDLGFSFVYILLSTFFTFLVFSIMSAKSEERLVGCNIYISTLKELKDKINKGMNIELNDSSDKNSVVYKNNIKDKKFNVCWNWVKNNKGILAFLVIIFFGPIISTKEPMKSGVIFIFGSSSNAKEYLQYFGTIIGGLATLLALYITVKETRKIQEENRKQTLSIKEIDHLKMQVEFSKNISKVAHECEMFLSTLNKKIEQILAQKKLLNDNEVTKEVSATEDHDKFNYEHMKNQKSIIYDLDIELKAKEVNTEINLYIQKLMIESASIKDEKINDLVEEVNRYLLSNGMIISNTLNQTTKNGNELKQILINQNNSINLTLCSVINLQFKIKEYISNNQNKINDLILNT